jgi:ABC-type sugar transport system permease subunit
MLLPFFLLLLIFWVGPLLGSIHLSTHSNEIFGTAEVVGLDNFKRLFGDELFFTAIRNTLVYGFFSIVVTLPFALWLAHLLRASFARLRPLLTFLLILPGLTPPVVLAILFLLVFHGEYGLLNALFLEPLGVETVHWLLDPRFIMAALVIQSVWRWTGFITLFMLSGLNGIPRDYLDHARMEGAGGPTIFRLVTLPLMRHILIFAGVYLFVDAFALFSGAYVLLGGSGGTGQAGLLLVTYTYQRASSPWFEFGTAAAVSLTMLPFLLFAMSLLFMRPFKRQEALV